ncbi:MAG: hypothetical protein OQK48_01775 [Sulfurimonas sp.]|uniref:hypothetical protein n=1 Tax=Sulfurimonas sp. TaxID=2022749 RepID=UPI00260859B8|nr:hypothetical protein [Sulfurimonas sp.]MCW8894836.1 hypothetical protein [Sulfurimonas sp.]MCW8953652.1 hypothetical protein [Sulfurimonas sp.]MCW9067703.1 hypothetical protein [Sulfurimonas sp.]
MEQDLELKSNKKRIDGIKLSVLGVALLVIAVFMILQNIMHMINTPEQQVVLIQEGSSMIPMYAVFGIVFLAGVVISIFGLKKITNTTA